ncbi:YoaK family protein [Streptomyces aurantiogriseus]|uniref:Membrane protein n=1 Tax=Streptomyces aurantiogriseus TaxID=66870 RepID=A0A918CLJ3_9ACTN|nr:YoaK family protein [Streptomyces aurantiogriseus]GGR30646.1 membrane protein [Streptomyces aurantiogriseus]
MTTEPSRNPDPGHGPDRAPEARGVRLVPGLLVLTVVSGMIDAVSFLGLGHVFTANMTGNVVVLGFAAAGAPGFSVHRTATSLVGFLAGAAAGGQVARRLAAGSRRAWARVALAVEAALLAASATVAFAAPDKAPGTVYTLIAVTAFTMGLRNATVLKLGVPDLTTTVMTRTLAGLAADSPAGGGPGTRSPRRAASVVAMCAGALLGAWLVLHQGLAVPLLLAALASGVLAVTVAGRDGPTGRRADGPTGRRADRADDPTGRRHA